MCRLTWHTTDNVRVRFFVDGQLNGGLNGCFFVNAIEVNRVFSSTAASVELPVGSTARPSSTRLGEAGWTSTEGKPRPQTRSTVSSTATRFFVNGAFLLNFLAQLVVHEKTHPKKEKSFFIRHSRKLWINDLIYEVTLAPNLNQILFFSFWINSNSILN